jgi:hypothetical protein
VVKHILRPKLRSSDALEIVNGCHSVLDTIETHDYDKLLGRTYYVHLLPLICEGNLSEDIDPL